jgi:TIR domain/WD domain, G-beta repeat
MTGKIFLSYRREDTAGFALALFGRLEQSFPPESLFMDVEGGIGAGQDFVRGLEEQISACDAMLVLIGPNWLTVRDDVGRRRLDNPRDFVRIEVESALKFGKRVIPVLVQKAEMPKADALPETLEELVRRNAVGLTQERFKADAQGLIKALEDALAEVEDAQRRAATEAAAAAEKRAAEEAAKAEEAARADKERTRLEAIAGASPEQISKAEELANWEFIKASESSQEFRDHLARFPQGVSERMARARLEALVWAGLPRPIDMDSVKGFLAEFPKGAHAGEANAKLAEVESQATAAHDAAEREQREMDAWASASAAGNVALLEVFQRNWPRSKYADAARKRIKEIKGGPSRRQLLGVGAGAAGLGGFAVLVFRRWLYDQSTRSFAVDGGLHSVVFLPDGRTALSNGWSLKLWDVATGKELRSFAVKGDWNYSVAVSHDGRTALSGGESNTLTVWDIATGEMIRTFAAQSSAHSVAISPDGRFALSGSSLLESWELATGKELGTFGGIGSGFVNSVAFSPDGRNALSSGGSNTSTLWDVATGKEIREFAGHIDTVNSVAFSPDGRSALSGSDDDTLRLWDVESSGIPVA